jgi:hypothetical protein
LGKKEKEAISGVITHLTMIPVDQMTELIEKYKM